MPPVEFNGMAIHRKVVDFVLVPLTVAALLWIGRTVMNNQTKLIEIDTRLQAMEAKTSQMPPADYRAYIDAKFAAVYLSNVETNRQLAELVADLKTHMREAR